jgi:glycosyltransferase involved in cell wall biosynthesis
MKSNKVISVIHLPSVVGGNPQGLSRYLNYIGINSESWTLEQNYFGYPADKIIYNKYDNRLLREIKRLLALRYVFRSDVVFFNNGQMLFQPTAKPYVTDDGWVKSRFHSTYRLYLRLMQILETALLRLQRKVVLVQYQGDDARQGDYSIANHSINIAAQVEPGYYSPDSDELKRGLIRHMASLCHRIYALNPDLLHLLPPGSEFLPYSHISLEEWVPSYTQDHSGPLRIGHAPSHRGVKGTEIILDTLKVLLSEGYEFELVLIEGLSNNIAKNIYQSVDVLVDQLFAGWYGGLGLEAMALGKPVVAYIRDEDLKFIPHQMKIELPIIRANPNTLYDTLKLVLTMPRGELLELARSSRCYVERWHNPVVIANRIKSDIETVLCSFGAP